ncbi:hypothetical protein BGZ74_003985, partial [Mortierella antarctica]
ADTVDHDPGSVLPSAVAHQPTPAAMESDENLLGGHSYNRYSGSSGSSAGASSLNALGETEEQSANGNRPSFSIGSPVLLSAPTKRPKERRSKSVIINSQHTGARAATAVPATASTEPRLGRACETKAILAEQQHASGVNTVVHNLVASLWADDVAARGVGAFATDAGDTRRSRNFGIVGAHHD